MNAAILNKEQVEIPIWRSLVVIGMIAAMLGACFLGTQPPARGEAGIVMDLPLSVGDFWGKREDVSRAEKELLPADTEFAKRSYEDGHGDSINCQIVLAGGEKRSIHRPEVCLVGQGWTVKERQVIPVKLNDGRQIDVMKLTITRLVTLQNGAQRELTSFYLYWFVGKDTVTPYHLVRILKTNLDMLLHNTSHRWAYVIVSSPVLEGFAPNGKSAEQTLDMLKGFIGEVGPQIMDEAVRTSLPKARE